MITSQLQTKYRFQIYVGPVDKIACFLRVHAQIYLELSDYQRLADAVLAILSSDDVDGAESNVVEPEPMAPMARSAPTEQ